MLLVLLSPMKVRSRALSCSMLVRKADQKLALCVPVLTLTQQWQTTLHENQMNVCIFQVLKVPKHLFALRKSRVPAFQE